jgi:hypothetical protein
MYKVWIYPRKCGFTKIYQHLFLSLGDISNDNEEYWAASRGNRQETVDLAIKDFH